MDEKGEKIFEKRYGTLTPDLVELRDTLPVFRTFFLKTQFSDIQRLTIRKGAIWVSHE